MTPAGVYVLESHQQLVNSTNLPSLRMSLASLNPLGKEIIFAFPGLRSLATFLDASLPCLSLSKQITTLSKLSTYSMFSLMSLTAP